MYTKITKEILQKNFKDECDLIGRENFSQLFDENSKIIKTDFGEEIPVLEVIGYLMGIIGFIESSCALHDRIKSKTNKAIKIDEFISLVREQLKIPEDIDDVDVVSILEIIIKKSEDL